MAAYVLPNLYVHVSINGVNTEVQDTHVTGSNTPCGCNNLDVDAVRTVFLFFMSCRAHAGSYKLPADLRPIKTVIRPG